MKNINFALHRVNQHKITVERWRVHTMLLLSVFCVCLLSISFIQWHHVHAAQQLIRSLKNKHGSCLTTAACNEQCKKEYATLQTRLNKITQWHNTHNASAQYLATLNNTGCKPHIQSVQMQKKQLQMTAHAHSHAEVLDYLECLKKVPSFEKLTLAHIQNTNDATGAALIHFSINGSINKQSA